MQNLTCPKPPKQGGAVLLERVAWFWRRLTSGWRMVIRDVLELGSDLEAKTTADLRIDFVKHQEGHPILIGKTLLDRKDNPRHLTAGRGVPHRLGGFAGHRSGQLHAPTR